MNAPAVVAIDGPAGSGKTSVARALAERLGWVHVDSGAMYRAFTWHLMRNGIDPRERAAVVREIGRVTFESSLQGRSVVFRVNGLDPEDAIRSEPVTGNVSAVAAVHEVREHLVRRQRDLVRIGPLVMEGRDIGTVVFPAAPHKFYLDASPSVRARRRGLEINADAEATLEAIESRDRKDSSRAVSPLRPAADAEILDTSGLTLEAVVERLAQSIRERESLPGCDGGTDEP